MGDGVFGSNEGSALIKNASIITTSYTVTNVSLSVSATDPDCYDFAYTPGESTFSYGGPGCPGAATVSNVLGDDQGSAMSAIIGAGLTVGAVTQDNRCIDVAGTVLAQSQTGGAAVSPGSAVNLVVSSGNNSKGQPCVLL